MINEAPAYRIYPPLGVCMRWALTVSLWAGLSTVAAIVVTRWLSGQHLPGTFEFQGPLSRTYDPEGGENLAASVRPHKRAARRYLVGWSSSGIRWATASANVREASRICTRIRTA